MTPYEVIKALFEGHAVREKTWSPDARLTFTPQGFVYSSALYPKGRPAALTLHNREYEIVE